MTSGSVLYIEDFQSVISRSGGRQVKVVCPFCHDRRSNKRDKSLSINTSTMAYHCHYCDAKGYLKSRMGEILSNDQRRFKPQRKEYVRPKPKDAEKEKVYSETFLEWFKGRGISQETLLKARVTQEVEYMGGKRCGCMAFNYYLGEELINIKFRTRDKQFKGVSDAQAIPYNINSIAQESYKDNEEKYCIITEGEIDTLTYLECGFEHTISIPNGANKNLEFLDDFIDSHFDKLDNIYISVDNDKKGLEERMELVRRFGQEKCRIIDYPSPCKDINEVLLQYGKDAVRECVNNYIELKPDGVQELVDVESNLDFIFNNGLQKGFTVGVPSVDKIVSFKTGMLNVVTGIPSHGKTYLLNYLLVRLNLLHDWKIAFFSPEFYPVSLHIAQIIETMGGLRFEAKNYTKQVYEEMKDYLCKNFFWIDPDDTDINSVMERAKYLIRKKGIKALVIDPFNALTDSQRKTQKQDEYISEFLQKLRWFARKYDVAVFIVMHPVKMSKQENGLYPVCDLYNCKGASEIFDKADIGLTVWRNEQEDYAELHITKIKFRHLGEKGHACFKFNINNGRYVEIENADDLHRNGINIRNMQVQWDNSNYIIEKKRGLKTESMFNNGIEPNTSFDDMSNIDMSFGGDSPF